MDSAREGEAPEAAPLTRVVVRAPAKLNLQLAVGPLGQDGFHPLATVFHAVSLFDEVVAERRAEGGGPVVTVVGEGLADVPLDSSNLAWRAAEALAGEFGAAPDVALTIRKGIPVAGGMAGGSADAAAALVSCARLWGLSADRADLLRVAARLGSDVPFPLLGGTAVGTGRGDRLTPALTSGSFHWVFALSEQGLSTPAVYRRFDELNAGRQVAAPTVDERVMTAVRSGDVRALAAALSNDLQPAALSLRPALQGLLDIGADAGALAGLVSGSGPTVAFLVGDADAAMNLTVALSTSGMCRAVRYAEGPAPGARVVEAA